MLKDRLNQDLVGALKGKDEKQVLTLRFLLSAIHNAEIDKRSKNNGAATPLTDEEIVSVLRSEAKKRKEARDIYQKSGRADLAGKEEGELAIIAGYLPPEMSEEELLKIISAAVESVKPAGPSDFGRVMALIMKELKGRADASRVAQILKSRLEN